MGVSVSASRGAGDRAGTITRMCLALMFLVTTSHCSTLSPRRTRTAQAFRCNQSHSRKSRHRRIRGRLLLLPILAAARLGLRRLAPALTSGVDFTILFAALAVLLGIESGAEDMAAALTRLVAEAQTTPIFVFAIFFSAVAVVRGIVPGAYDVVFRKGAAAASGPEAAGCAGERGEREGGERGDLHDAEN